jgi:Amt family ammonium transporter
MPVDSGDTAWVLGCAALVLFMTPGLALFYGGMVRSKNVLGIMVQNFAAIAVVGVVWAIVAYTLAFGPDLGGGLLGGFKFAGLAHGHASPAGMHLSIPPFAFAAFQMMFAIITVALLTGAGADRLSFRGFLAFAVVWTLLVYAPIAHWIFSPEGWLAQRGVLDFAGGNVVEIDSGASALALALVLGRRHGWPREVMAPHSLPLTVMGAGILWFGWFGFNAGSALAADGTAAEALITTQLAACTGLLGWLAVEYRRTRSATTLGAASGAVAGLVAITPGAGYVPAWAALVIGLAAGIVGELAVRIKFRFGYDDSLDVVAVHGICGLLGTLCVGLFALPLVTFSGHHEGLLLGGGLHQLGVQALAVVTTAAWAFLVTYGIARVVSATLGLRVTREQEIEGVDISVHAETAYDIGALRSSGRTVT